MRVVTGGTTFAERGMFENDRLGLLAMALGARFIQARHGQTPGGLHDVLAMRVVALDAIHFPFDDRMMLG